jgi:hypothetical protein
MQNLNAYNQEQFQQQFQATETYQILNKKYDHVCFVKFFETVVANPTPRQVHAGGYCTAVSAVPWYYLNYLDSTKPMVDLGCGMNFFKPYFSNIIGIGAEKNDKFYGDIHDYVDEEFYAGHVGLYESVFSINALHFAPLANLRDICIKFSNMLAPGGRGFLALNVKRMLEHNVPDKDLSKYGIDTWIRKQFENFPCTIIVFDLDTSVLDAYMDGNIRIVFEKNKN